jgi:SAM-dependent methyltransferase
MSLSLTVEREILRQCPLCGSETSSNFDERIVRGENVTNRICRKCGLVYQSPRMTAEALQQYYRSAYMVQHQGQLAVTQEQLEVQAARAEHLLSLLVDSQLAVKQHLDVGCSTGELMSRVSRAFRCESSGIEPSDDYRKYCRERGLAVYESIEMLKQAKPAKFDLITMAHVLEHLKNASDYLRTLRAEFLSESGYLLVEVPNLFYHPSFELPHLVSYHRGTLVDQLQQGGFRVVWIRAHGRPRHKRIPLYLTALAQATKDGEHRPPIQSTARGVKLSRALGQAIYQSAPRIMSSIRSLRGNGSGDRT